MDPGINTKAKRLLVESSKTKAKRKLTSMSTKSSIDLPTKGDNYLSAFPAMLSTTDDISRLLPSYPTPFRPPVRSHSLTAHLAPRVGESTPRYPEQTYFHLPMFTTKTSPLLSPNLQIAPAFAQIYHRRRRRENRPRRQRTTFTSDQTLQLEVEYTRADYISRPRRLELADTLQLSESQIKIWFQNRRAKDKRIEKAHMDRTLRPVGYQSLPPAYTSSTHPALCTTCAVPAPLSFCVQQHMLTSPKSQ